MMTSKSRIRVLFPYADSSAIGGSHTSSLTLAARLDREVFDPVVLLHGPPSDLDRRVRDFGFEPMRLEQPPVLAGRLKKTSSDASPGQYLFRTVPKLMAFLKANDIDIVHTNDGGMHSTWALPSKLAKVRFVWHHRQPPDTRGVNYIAPLFADRVISVSDFAYPNRPLRSLADRFEVVRSPFEFSSERPDRTQARAALLSELGLTSDATIIGFFGALTKRKRPDHFVRVMAACQSALPSKNVHGVIFGQEPVENLDIERGCRELAQDLGIEEKIHLMGHRAPVEPLMAAVDIIAVTAIDEPFGRTLIEGMHVGTPVVATRHGGNPEAIADGENGFLVETHDPASFVPPILHLLDNDDVRDKLVDKARAYANSLTVEAHVDAVSRIYFDLLGRPDVAAVGARPARGMTA